LQEETVKVS